MRGLVGAKENEGQSGYGQGHFWTPPLKNILGVRSARAKRVTCPHKLLFSALPTLFPSHLGGFLA